MRHTLFILLMLAFALVLQAAIVPAFLPPVLRPDIALLFGIAILAFGALRTGLIAIFVMGVSADLLGSGRFGLLTLCYVLTAGGILLTAWREFSRGDYGVPWIACAIGTAFAHLLYCVLGNLIGLNLQWGRAMGEVLSLFIAACVWGFPVVYVVSRMMFRFHVMLPEIQARWTNDDRIHGARNAARLN